MRFGFERRTKVATIEEALARLRSDAKFIELYRAWKAFRNGIAVGESSYVPEDRNREEKIFAQLTDLLESKGLPLPPIDVNMESLLEAYAQDTDPDYYIHYR